MKTFTCATCGASFTRGRGRPPAILLCPVHANPKKDATMPHKPEKRAKNNRKPRKGIQTPPPVEYSSEAVLEAPEVKPPEIHGYSGTAITEPCPVCLYAYADGGYCPECEWSLPIVRLPYGTSRSPNHDVKER